MSQDEFFTELWLTYPRDLCHRKPGAKSVAKKAVEKLNPDPELQKKILHGLREWMRLARKEAKIGKTDRWPFLSTWLNQERWLLDDIPQSEELHKLDASYNPKCSCGHPIAIEKKCWSCYDKTSAYMAAKRKFLYENLKAQGLAMGKDEKREDWILRVTQWGAENTSMAGFTGIRQGLLQKLKGQV